MSDELASRADKLLRAMIEVNESGEDFSLQNITDPLANPNLGDLRPFYSHVYQEVKQNFFQPLLSELPSFGETVHTFSSRIQERLDFIMAHDVGAEWSEEEKRLSDKTLADLVLVSIKPCLKDDAVESSKLGRHVEEL